MEKRAKRRNLETDASPVFGGNIMIDVESATELINRHIVRPDKQKVSLNHLAGKTLAEPIKAERDGPPFDRVAMDGIAVCYKSFIDGYAKIEGIQQAGYPPLSLKQSGNVIEVTTGAILPHGTDTIVPYEDIVIGQGLVTLKKESSLKKGSHIHCQGSDYGQGTLLLKEGTCLNSTSVALIAGQGSCEEVVFKLPKVAIVSTGDELVMPGNKCEEWQIWHSNLYGIQVELMNIGFTKEDLDFYHIKDDRKEMRRLLTEIFKTHQIIILSGGVSKGKYDFVTAVMSDLKVKEIFHRVRQKPGRPMYFGVKSTGQNIFGLPGNPISSLVCTRKYIIPALQKALGLKARYCFAVLEEDIPFKKNLCLFKEVTVSFDNTGQLRAYPVFTNGSGDFFNLAKSDGFLQLPAEETIYKKGDVFPFFSWAKGSF